LQYLARLWHLYGTKPQIQILDKMMRRIQQVGRLQHFCATPLLFTSQWRQKVSLVRDHTLEPVTNDAKFMYFDENRSRHSSGNSCKGATESIATSRSRRLSGQPTNTNSFSVKMRNSFDDGWHIAVCTHYIQEYVQYLQTLGFVAVQLKNIQHTSSRSRSKDESDANTVNENGTGGSFYQKLGSRTGLSTNFLYKSLMGGLLVFEVGVVEPYVYSYLYSLEGKRLQSATMNSKIPLSQFVCSFLDEIDKVKVTMHLHSFTYDYHLRTIHSYISGRQLIFKQGYHLISFLEDFMKYYQKAPNFARNQIHAGELKMQNMNITADQLYNYITSHNEVYGMNVFRVVSFLNDQEVNQSTSPEYVLIQLSSQSVPYRDHLDARQLDNFDIALLICQNKNHCEPEKNSICLKYFVLLTSQREVYPKLCTSGIGAKLGCVRPIRLGTSLPPSRNPSRKNSSNTEPTNDVPNSNSFSSQSTKETSLNTSFSSNEPTLKHSSSKTLLNVKTIKSGMCDEDVCYLGYFSSHEEMMLQLLKEKADSAHQQLGEILSQAAVHCRRDHFWKSLNQDNVQLTYTQFNELLSLVVVKKITDFDSNLLSYSTLQFSFYQNVAKTLNSKYGVTNHKQFYSPDGKVIQHIYFNKASEGFMLLALDSEKQTAEAGLVFKECLMDIKAEDYASYDVQLIKDYLSACVHNKTNQQNKSKRFFFWKKS
ncbi:Protein SZT2-like protein, partial [Leptotrombidium deliense]